MSDTPRQLPNESDGDYIYRLADHFGIPRYMTKQIRLPEKQSSSWQPIETAPKDGTFILVVEKNFPDVVIVCQFGTFLRGIITDWKSQDGDVVFPWKWMPLPQPPTK